MAFIAFVTISSYVACTKEDLTSTSADTVLDAVTDESLNALESRGSLGAKGCYDLVFPVTIKFADGSTKAIPNQDSLRKAVKGYCKRKDSTQATRPTFVFPIQVTAEDGSVITVNSEDELKTLKAACKKNVDSLHAGRKHDTLCFSIVFPIQVKKADSSIVTINSKEDLKALGNGERGRGRGHGKHHGLESQLQIVFPITIKKADGTTETIASKEALKAAREACSN